MRNPIAVCLHAINACVVSVPLTLPMQSWAADECRTVRIGEFGGAPGPAGGPSRRPEVHLKEAGPHCLAEDARQRKLLNPRTGEEMRTLGGEAVVLIGADGIRLDLGGHVVSNERSLGYTLIKHYDYQPGRSQIHRFTGTHVRNGRLISPGSRGVGLRLVSAGVEPNGFSALAEFPAGTQPVGAFAATSHLVEDLTIQAGYRAILIDGRNNVIRNNRIVVDSATAILAHGPGIVIENNVIEVKNDLSHFSDYARKIESKTPFPIRLIQADRAIVRNNEIRLLYPAARGPLPAAIELLQSADVLVESNRVEGVGLTVRADSDSSYREIDNQLAVCGPGSFRFLPPDEAEAGHLPPLPSCR